MTHSVIGMIYRSLDYLEFMLRGMKPDLIVANDATPQVLDALQASGVKYLDYRDPKPNDYYLNRVYRAWNAGAKAAESDVIVFCNSDMHGAPNWLPNLLKHLTPDTIPCSRLVESGKMPSGQHALVQDFGRSAKTFEQHHFERYAKIVSKRDVVGGGLFMPCAFNRREFLDAGGYPEGNICKGGVGAHETKVLRSGDEFFFRETLKEKRHVTVMNSIVYHIQQAEMDS